MPEIVCNNCGKEFYAKTRRARYCCKKCMDDAYEKKVKENKIGSKNKQIVCVHCGKPFYVSQSRVNQSEKKGYEIKYCSKSCHESDKNRTLHQPNYSKLNIERICKICGKPFLTRQYDIDKGNGIFCSYKCAGESKQQGVVIICEVCGKEFNSYKCRIGIRKTCSRKCASILKSKECSEVTTIERKRGESKEWTKAVYLKDNYTCQKCGKRGGVLNAHHIIPFSVDKTLRYEISNGITLCVDCHKKEHKRLRKISKEQIDIFSCN